MTDGVHPSRRAAPSRGSPERSPSRLLSRYVMIGGFLGAGKTTSVARLARWLTDRKLRVGLITNDQGGHLVDTATLAAGGFPVEEIAGGCFCCRFSSLVEAAQRLSAVARPDVFLAEPVGSCTDLVATVSYPLRQLYGADYSMAPLSVVVDPVRALRVLGLEPGGRFSDKVVYIYRKQLEEADLLVINKCDTLGADRRNTLRAALAAAYPHARLFEVSARQGHGLEDWFRHVTRADAAARAAIELDYEQYADGESRLGWLNGTLEVSATGLFDGNALLRELASEIQRRLIAVPAEVAHLKMTLDTAAGLGDLGIVSVVGNDHVPELSQDLAAPIRRGELTVNLRAEGDPDLLHRVALEAVQQVARARSPLTLAWQHLEWFRPGKPQPTHRLTQPPPSPPEMGAPD